MTVIEEKDIPYFCLHKVNSGQLITICDSQCSHCMDYEIMNSVN